MAENKQKIAVIIGGGPAGLTAALELLRQSDIRPIVLEASNGVGGISQTTNFNGYRMDLGGHRFFSKSDWVMDWWLSILPLEPVAEAQRHTIRLGYRNSDRGLSGLAAGTGAGVDGERVMLLRDRLSRIYFNHKLFDYPISLNLRSISKLGLWRCLKIGASYAKAKLSPRQTERHLEDFLINRFGDELYRTFFQAYTEKVWGVPCDQLSAEWGAQRIKSVSLTGAVRHALRRFLPGVAKAAPTSLVERFLYPRLGPGQLWETVARQIQELGGEIRLAQRAEQIELVDGRVKCVVARDVATGTTTSIAADWAISTMAVSDLIAAIQPPAPGAVAQIAAALPYRHFIVVGVLVTRMKRRPGSPFVPGTSRLPDNWIYVQEPDVKMGRLQIFNNWSPALVPDPNKVWLGVEYFCSDTDELWSLSDAAIQALAVRELAQIELVDAHDVETATVVRVPKAYPAYFGSYAQFDTIRSFVDPIENLFLVGRNGMHRYNNQDHSMLTAKAAVDIIVAGRGSKDAIWDVNVDDDYHESIND
mgnify:FL=1